MVPRVAHRVRTATVLTAAAGTIVAALLLDARQKPACFSGDDTGMGLVARSTDQELAVLVTAPNRATVRPPISLAVVVDSSPSMDGEPLANAKAAASRLLDELEPGDAFSIVTFDGTSRVVTPTAMATGPNKASARSAIDQIGGPTNGTCIACGLQTSVSELARSPILGGVSRIVVISDGDANIGIGANARGTLAPIADEVESLAADIARRGISISSVGTGLEFNEVLMTRIAAVGQGNYYFVEDTKDLGSMFDREIASISKTVATDVKLVIHDGQGMFVEQAYGYPMTRVGSTVVIPVADLRAGETRKVVLRVSSNRTGDAPRIQLGWRWVSDGSLHDTATVAKPLANPVTTATDRGALDAIEQALSARTIDWATQVYETEGARAAIRILEQRGDAVRANPTLSPAARERIERAQAEAIDGIQNKPAQKVRKVNSVNAYELAR
jgi:Ca-activated chloride channel family protein